MDEVDEIDENHMESNDAFAAYVIWINMKIIDVNQRILFGKYSNQLYFHDFWRLQKVDTKEKTDHPYIARNLDLRLNNWRTVILWIVCGKYYLQRHLKRI